MSEWLSAQFDSDEMQVPSTPKFILVLQSDSSHVHLIQTVLSENEMHPHVVAIADSQEALAFLRREGTYETAQRPDLILLDLELPGETEHHALLSTLKGDPLLRRIPIIVLTLADHPEEIFTTYALHGNCHVVKPGEREQLTQTIQRIEEFWLRIVTLPLE